MGEDATGFEQGCDIQIAIVEGEELCTVVETQGILHVLAIQFKILQIRNKLRNSIIMHARIQQNRK